MATPAATRPDRLPIWSGLSVHRLEPPAGTAQTGYPYGFKVPRVHYNWSLWATGAWAYHLDAAAFRGPDHLDRDALMRVSSTSLGFATGLGSGLAQRPNSGGIYLYGGERLDMSATGVSAPVFTFAPSAVNRVWARVRRDGGRSPYPEVTVTQSDALPDTGYVKLGEATTNLTSVVSYVETTPAIGITYAARHSTAFQGTISIDPDITDPSPSSVLQVRGMNSFAPSILIDHKDPLATSALVSAQPNDGADAFVAYCHGEGAALRAYSSGGATAVHIEAANSGGACLYLNQGTSNYALSIVPSGFAPSDVVGPYSGTVRIQAFTGFGPNLMWVNYLGTLYYPWATPQQATKYTGNLSDATIVNGAANATVATSANQTFVQGCTYDIAVECRAGSASLPTFQVTVTIQVNGVTDTYWNARSLTPHIPSTSHVVPWLSTRILYTHSGATTNTATISIIVSHSAGSGSINYRGPRFTILGGIP